VNVIAAVFSYAARVITPAQIRAARALLGWTQAELAAAAGIGVVAVKLFEGGRSDPRSSTVAKIEHALDAAGIIFFDAGENRDGGPGLRLKRSSA
jgi:transcriptional regulator with XRE-family HTH domain